MEGRMAIKVEYDDIYLVAVERGIHPSFRVTKRDGPGRPKTVRFLGNRPDDMGRPMGTLVINEDLWEEWYGEDKKLANMETAEIAAETMVKNNPNVHYGCPLCTVKFSTYEASHEHIINHAEEFIQQFRIEIGEE
jgi:hypothetical protein